MRKFIKIILIMIFVLLILQVVSNAATATATWTADKTEVKPGDTVAVTLKVSSADGINGIIVDNIAYDAEKLELQETKMTEKLSNLSGSKTKIEAISLSAEKITEVEVYKMTFKVKENAVAGTVTISTTDIIIDTDVEKDSQVKEIAKTVSLDIVDPEKKEPTPGKDQENPKDTESKEPAPDTGLEDHLFIVIIAVLAIALISYKGYKKFSF